MDTTERFSGLAEIYASARPAYPEKAIDYIVDRCNLKTGSVLVDIGCGTGISSRLLAARGMDVIGVEPNADMIEKARTANSDRRPTVRYVQARAEQTGLDDASADAVLCAQSFHWFDPELALREFHRILNANGWAVLMWNIRDNRDAFTRAYGEAFDKVSADITNDCSRGPKNRDVILTHPLFRNAEEVSFANEQTLDRESLIDRAFSASYAPRRGELADQLKELLNSAFDRYEKNGIISMKYSTAIYSARKK